MPTAIPQVPPPKQPAEINHPKPTARRKREDSFRAALNGAKNQVKPKQKEQKATEPAAEQSSKPPAADEAPTTPEAVNEEVVETFPPPRRKERIRKPAGSEVAETARATPTALFSVPIDVKLLEDVMVEAAHGGPAESAIPSDVATSEEQQLACLTDACVQTVENAEVVTETAEGASIPQGSIRSLQALETGDAPAAMTDDTAPQVTDAAGHAHSDRIEPAPLNAEIVPEALIEEAQDLAEPPPRAGVTLPKELMRDAEQPLKETVPTRRDVPPVFDADAEIEQRTGEDHASAGESAEHQSMHASPSFARRFTGTDLAETADPAAMPIAPKSDQPQAMNVVLPPTLPIADPIESRFAEANHPRIITAVQAELLPTGGSVRLRLDPPELGALQVRIDVKDGVLTASFQTSNDEATRLLTRSLHQLKNTLESHGVTVEKLHVQQTPREQWDGGRNGDDRQQQSPHQWQQQEQQRREMLQRMWRRVRDGRDPFDLVA